jgi:hypothetical protein
MYILTLSEPLENCKNNLYRFRNEVLESRYLVAGYQVHERRYQIKIQHKTIVVTCTEFRSGAMSIKPIVIIPEFLVPGRPYPLYVYLYAIDLYSRSPEKGQRWVAGETRKRFGLATFAHTTLGRALKALIRSIGAEDDAPPMVCSGVPEADVGDKPEFQSVRSTAVPRRKAALFLGAKLAVAGRGQLADACCALARKWFALHQRFLL